MTSNDEIIFLFFLVNVNENNRDIICIMDII